MVHKISKTTELPSHKLQTYILAPDEKAEEKAGEHEAWLLQIKNIIYLFIAEA